MSGNLEREGVIRLDNRSPEQQVEDMIKTREELGRTLALSLIYVFENSYVRRIPINRGFWLGDFYFVGWRNHGRYVYEVGERKGRFRRKTLFEFTTGNKRFHVVQDAITIFYFAEGDWTSRIEECRQIDAQEMSNYHAAKERKELETVRKSQGKRLKELGLDDVEWE